ncbi:MAG: TIGR01212 family radical SAM protein [Candidatus Delongbacteria bacterium]|jgi:radical SAM protein (TIGR01212 family)|nr:TIGR01212 family radical SAM protein [Candidatus Delongbacteria bacterium]
MIKFQRVNRVGEYWKRKYGDKTYKLIFKGNFTCPNIDGTLSDQGCIYCNMRSLEPLIDNSNIEEHIKYLENRNNAKLFYAFFQDYSSTYPIHSIKNKYDYLKEIYTNSIDNEKIVGISVSTRPDCIDNKILDILSELNKDVIIELGLQTTNVNDITWMNRGHANDRFIESVELIKSYGFEVVTHMILGLPEENDNTIIANAKFLNDLKIHGIKFHQLMVLKNTKLENLYNNSEINILSIEEYFRRVSLFLSYLNKDIVVHRLYGDAPKKDLIAPKWCINKTGTQDKLFNYLEEHNICQGCNII